MMAGDVVVEVGGPNVAPGAAPLEFVPPTGPGQQGLADKAKDARAAARARVAAKIDGPAAAPVTTAPAIDALIPERVRKLAQPETVVDATPDGEEAVAEGEAAPGRPEPSRTTAASGETQDEVEQRVLAARAKAKATSSRHRRLMAEKQQLEGRVEAHKRELQQVRQQAARGQQLEETLRRDPVKALIDANVNADQLVDRVMRAGTPEEKFAAMQEQIAAERAERLRLEKTLDQRRSAENLEASANRCYGLSQQAERYPNLQGYAKDFVLGMVETVARKNKERIFRETGVAPIITDKQILRLLNDSLPARAATAAAKVDQPAKGGTSGSPERPGKSKSAGKPPRTLTSTTTQSGVTRPGNWESLPRSERLAALKGQ